MIELTERLPIEKNTLAYNNILYLCGNDIYLAIDDFGAGYSGLGYILNLPLTHLKIDMLLIEQVNYNNKAIIIIEYLAGLCKQLGIKTIAEGIENENIVSKISHLEINSYQGYYFSHPLSLDDFLSKHQMP